MNRTSRKNPKAEKVLKTVLKPVEDFTKLEASSGLVLIAATLIAMIWANSSWQASYDRFVELQIGLEIGGFVLKKSLHHWVNDGLMVIFFFVVGLEIKRELILGELSSPRKAALPMFAALGGMVVPALIYLIFNAGGPYQSGWGIPMATDIAFAVGILSLLGKRCPFALKVFLLALAIVDDLGAVLVIAFFYTDNISGNYLAMAAATFFATFFIRLAGVKSFLAYTVFGIIAWFAVFKSGVHATIAGVILGLMTPVKPFFDPKLLPGRVRELAESINKRFEAHEDDQELLKDNELAHDLSEMSEMVKESASPLDRLIHALHVYVGFLIMPAFALVNAGVHLSGVEINSILQHPISLGVILGLVLGKPIGVVLFSFAAVKFKFADLPSGVTWRHMMGVGSLAGIGFTMALFIGHLALKFPSIESYSKLGILIGSGLSAIIGVLFLMLATKRSKAKNYPSA